MREQDHRLGSGLLVLGAEAAADHRLDPHQVEEVGGDPSSGVAVGQSFVAEIDGAAGKARQTFEALLLRAPVLEVVLADLHALDVARQVVALQVVEPVGVLERQAAQEDAVEDGIHTGGKTDAETHGDHRHGARGRALEEHAEGVSKLAEKGSHVSALLQRWV